MTSSKFEYMKEGNPMNKEHHVSMSSSSLNPPSHLPSTHLLHGRREDFNEICVPLYHASTKGDLEAAKEIIAKRPDVIRAGITESYDTMLHVAVSGKSSGFVKYLMSLMTKEDMELRNRNGETSLHAVARAGNVEIAKILMERNEGVIDIPDNQGRMPLHVAALFGYHDIVKYLYQKSHKMSGEFWVNQNQSLVLEACIENFFFDVAIEIVTDLPKLAINGRLLRLLARRRPAFNVEISNRFGRIILAKCCRLRFTYETKPALVLLRMILREVMKLGKAEIDDILRGPPDETKQDGKRKYSQGVLFLAAEIGNTEFLIEMIQQYPHIAQEVDDNNQSIFHVAVSRREEKIFKLLNEQNHMHIKDSVISLEDVNGNNMLHLAAGTANDETSPRNIIGMGLRLNQEIDWFWKVNAILPRRFRYKMNSAGLTPVKVFTKNHKDLLFNEQKLMKETATQLMVVAALVATISFATIFTFPGGYKEDTGIPIFFQKNLSKVFVVLDCLSFISSTTSILMVLSILGSDYNAFDLTSSLPIQFTICLASVFFSIITIIFTFLINLYLLYQNNSVRMPTIFCTLATIPYVVFLIKRYRLLKCCQFPRGFRMHFCKC